MKARSHNWKRFWCPREASISLADGGYLPDPDAKFGELYNPFVVPFESIADVPCLALLGEPGQGKSKVLSEEYTAVARQVRDQGDQALFIDLRAYQTDMMLQKAIFEDADFRAWSSGTHQLHLFLDSLDEARLRLGVVTTLLVRELQKYPIERLRLRIACRTAEWPSSFEEDLQELWVQRFKVVESELDHAPEVAPPDVSVSSTSIGPSAVLQPRFEQDNDTTTDAMAQLATEERRYIYAFALAPLRRLDVATAAMDYRIDPAEFFSAIDRSRAVAFAINPTSLKFLLDIFREKGSLPSARSELYEEGCRHLLGESMRARREAGLGSNLAIDQQMAVASRIAAATMFARRYSIQTNEYGDKADEGDVSLRDVCSGNEDGLGISAHVVQEVLETPLFSPRGPQRTVWSHQTYAEFFAARYLVQQKVSLIQILGLITHSSDPSSKLIPQLYETVAWLASLRRDVFREVMAREPEVLLRSDVIGVSDHDRTLLVEALLLLFDQEQLLDDKVDVRQSYPRLKHPGLADQLRPYICDRSKGWLVRRVAIDIAEGCELRELQDDLGVIALDPADFHPTRVNAAYAVMRIGDAEARAKLRPLVFGEAGDDLDDELKGCGLSAMWPDHLTAAELFAVLSPPKRRNFFGSYSMFFSDKLIEKLNVVDLPVALRWVEQQPAGRPWHAMQEVMNSIMLRAWETLETPGVLESFASAALERLRHHEEVVVEEQPFLRSRANGEPNFAAQLRSDHRRRRTVLGALLPLCTEPTEDGLRLVFNHTPFAQYEDLSWLIERFEVASTAPEQRVLTELITRVFAWGSQEHLEIAYDAWQRIPALAGCFTIFQPIDLHSPEANRLRTDYLKRQEHEDRATQQRLVEPPPVERVVQALDEFEAGKRAAWWHLNMEMTLEPTSTHYGNELESDLTSLSGWKEATPDTRARMVSAANIYLREATPEPDQWRGTNTIYRPAFAGYRALRLLLQVAPELLSQLPEAVWQRWAPIIIAYPITHGDGKEGPHLELVRVAYQQAPAEIIESLIFEIDHENRESESIWVIDKAERCLDQRMSTALLAKASDATLKPGCLASLLEFLLKNEAAGARSFAESLIAIPVPEEAEARTRMLRACIALMTLTKDAAWPSLWPVFQNDSSFGQDIISAVAHGAGIHSEGFVRRLTPDQVADLYIWLVRRYPPSEDPQDDLNDDIMHAVTPHESVVMWRDSLVRELQQRGTFQAVEALRRIVKEVPEIQSLKWALLDAQSEARRQTWIAPQPAYVLDLVGHQDKRFVRNGRELLEVLCESLIRLEAKLRGETPAAIDLWNEVGGKIKHYTPKDENRLSDYVKRHLNEDLKARGVIVGRELEFRRGTGGKPGERIDIMVDAVVLGHEQTDSDTISVVIETKGCWHRELDHAMQTQLVERYLLESSCRYGLYLVGWFTCDQWDQKDSRQRRAPTIELVQARTKFDRQAEALSREGRLIKAFVLNTALR